MRRRRPGGDLLAGVPVEADDAAGRGRAVHRAGTDPAGSRSRFDLINHLVGLLAATPRLVVVDEAQRLNGECIEMLRHLHDHPAARFALLYVGGDGCWEVLSREPMLRSRIFRRLPFTALPPPGRCRR